MKIEDFYNIAGKKVLIADSVSVGNALRRSCNKNGKDTVDFETFTPLNIAKELVTAYEAVKGDGRSTRGIGRDAAAYLFDEVIAQNRPDFIPEQSLSIATVEQIYQTVAVIRSFEKTPEYAASQVPRIAAIRDLITRYEDRLEKDNIYDSPRFLQKAIEILKKIKNGKDALPLSFYLPWIEDCTFGDLNTNRRKGLEENLIVLMTEICKKDLTSIDAVAYDSVDTSMASGKVDWNFFVSYGQHNEVRHVAEEILKLFRSGERSFDEIDVFFTSSDYENYIAGIFDYCNIPYTFKDCYHGTNTEFVQLLIEILDFIDAGYRYELLEKIVQNSILTFANVCGDTQRVNPNTAFSRTPGEKIGWGRERFIHYLMDKDVLEVMDKAEAYAESLKSKAENINETDQENDDLTSEETEDKSEEEEATEDANEGTSLKRAETPEERQERYALNQGFFALFLKELLAAFDETNTLHDTYSKLLEFACRYTRSYKRKDIIESLRQQTFVFSFVSGARYGTEAEKISYIRNFLEKFTFSKTTGPIAVKVNSFSKFTVLERPVNYIIGMGAKQFAVNNTESAIMSDNEMKQFLKGNNIPYAGERNVCRQEQFKLLLQSLAEGNITIGYSNFNTVDLRECSPSVIFMELSGDRELGPAVTYSPVDTDIKIQSEDYREWVDKLTENEDKNERKPAVTSDEEATMSASQLQVLLDCPLKYYYSHFMRLKVPVRRELRGDQWLPPMDRGNLLHRVFQHYMEECMPPRKSLLPTPDLALFEKIYEEQVKLIEDEVPWASDIVKDQEIQENKAAAEKFLTQLHSEWTEDTKDGKNWWVLGCELDFEYEDNLIYEDDGSTLRSEEDLESEDSGKPMEEAPKRPYSIHFGRGQIDRLDGYVDDGCLNLRIIDYKTGKMANKQREIEENIQIQHFVYAMAAFEYVRKLKNRSAGVINCYNIFDTYDINSVRIVEAAYDFPFEEDENRLSVMDRMETLLSQDENDPFTWKVEFPDGVREKLRCTEGFRQNGFIEEAAENATFNSKAYGSNPKSCVYCDYEKVCRTRCGVNKEDDDNVSASLSTE